MDIFQEILRLRPDVVVREEERGFLYYNPATDQIHLVSDEGAALVALLDGKTSVAAAIDSFVQPRTDPDAERTKWLSVLFIHDLCERKLLVN